MRNVLSNVRVEDREDLVRYYRDWFWEFRELGDWGRDADQYRRLRLATKQYVAIRDHVQSLTTFEALERWMCEHRFETQANPASIIDSKRLYSSFQKVTISNVCSDVDIDIVMYEGLEEVVEGRGWTFDLIALVDTGFNYKTMKAGLCSLGIYADSSIYTYHDGSPAYVFSCSILERDFQMTDANDPRWQVEIDEDDDKWIDTLIREDHNHAD